MRLKQIRENLAGQQLEQMFNSNGAYFSRPDLQTTPAADTDSGHDAGSRVAGDTNLPTGVPRKKRHRKFMGVADSNYRT